MPSNPIASQINLSEPLKSSDRPAEQTWILYFITGNPGLIEYYRTFFTHLYGLLSQQSQNSSSSTMDFQIFGRSLLGFEVGLPDTQDRERKKGPPYGLQEQITSCQEELEGLLERVRKSTKTADVRVILMGHSVGSYMVLEIIRRLRGRVPTSRETVPRIVGGVCLFPTVTHIAQSASGRKSSVCLHVFCRTYPIEVTDRHTVAPHSPPTHLRGLDSCKDSHISHSNLLIRPHYPSRLIFPIRRCESDHCFRQEQARCTTSIVRFPLSNDAYRPYSS